MTHQYSTNELNKRIKEFSQTPGLPFSGVLSEDRIKAVLAQHGVVYRNRVFSPTVTLWAFLNQVLSQDHSCRESVARVLAYRAATGQKPCSARTGGYVRARYRLPVSVIAQLANEVGNELEEQCPQKHLWKNRHVKIVDGSTVSMPDTPENQNAYPQPSSQEPGLGFPIARIVAIFSLATGAILDFNMDRFSGKETGELSLFKPLIYDLSAGDVILADGLYGTFNTIHSLKQRGADCVFARSEKKAYQGSIGELGKGDHIITLLKPQQPSVGMNREEFRALPKRITVRQIATHGKDRKGNKKQIFLVTTLLDHEKYPKEDIIQLYRDRWNCELDLRSVKDVMQMDILRCKSPDMVEKEIFTHLLAYNLIRSIILRAAEKHDKVPRKISFKGAVQTVATFSPYLQFVDPQTRETLVGTMLDAIASHPVGYQPGRIEPRAIKRRKKWTNSLLKKPRSLARKELVRRYRYEFK